MIKYEVVSHCLILTVGTVELTASQANDRVHALSPIGDGLYEIKAPIQFKRGEVVGYEGAKLNPSLVEEVGKAPKKDKSATGEKFPEVVDTVEVVTLADLADALEKSQKETKQILEEHASYTEAKAGKDVIPPQVTQKLIELGMLEEVTE